MRMIAVVALAAMLAGKTYAENLTPFVLPYDDGTDSITDVRRVLPVKEANQRVIVRDGHLYIGNDRTRFFGVNICTGSAFPDKTEAPKVAARLAKFGINTVRFHHIDASWGKPSIYTDLQKLGTRQLNPDSLDKLDFFVRELQKQGVYTNLNTLVSRPFSSKDGLPAEIDEVEWKTRASIGFWYEPIIKLQQEYATQMLSRKNPYTGQVWASDPAVAFVEINNENGLMHSWFGGSLDKLPAIFEKDLARQWHTWLKEKYDTDAKLQPAWQSVDEPLGAEMLGTLDPKGWNFETHGAAQATATRDGDAIKLDVTAAGTQNWHVQFHKGRLAFKKGHPYTISFQAKADKPRGLGVYASMASEPWTSLGLNRNVKLTDAWQTFTLVMVPTATEDNARLVFGDLAKQVGTVWLKDVSLKPGGTIGLSADESLARGTIPTITRGGPRVWPTPVRNDWLAFLYDTEHAYWQRMQRFLKEDIKVQSIVFGTIIANSPPNIQSKLDAIDSHAYWHHPHFPGRAWDMNNWTVQNQSIFEKSSNTLTSIAMQRVVGKPHFVTEYNHPAPNNYASEGPLVLATMASLQDWDALYMFDYSNSVVGSQRIDGFFAISQHPLQMANVATAALMFRRGDIDPLRETRHFHFPDFLEKKLITEKGGAWHLADLAKFGLQPENAYIYRLGMKTGQTDGMTQLLPKVDGKDFDTPRVNWRFGKDGRMRVVTPRAAIAAGFIGDTTFPLGEIQVATGKTSLNWLTLSLMQVKGDALGNPGTILVTASGTAENTGQQWKDDKRNSLASWGKAPSLVEPVPITLTFRVPHDRIKAWSLDERGARKDAITIDSDRGWAQLKLQRPTIWYEIEVQK